MLVVNSYNKYFIIRYLVCALIDLECCFGLTQYNVLKQLVHKTQYRSISV